MSVMFSISASLCRTGNALMPRSGSTHEILVLVQEQEDGHASADIHGSPEPTDTPMNRTHHHQHRHDPERPPGEERAPLPGLQALIFGCPLQLRGSPNSPRGPAQVGWVQCQVRPNGGEIRRTGWTQAAQLEKHLSSLFDDR